MTAWFRAGSSRCIALALLACEPAEPEVDPTAPVETAAPDSIVEELPPAVQERLAPELAAAPPTSEPSKTAKAQKPPAEATRPSAAPTAAAAAVAAAKATSEEPEHPSLDILLKQPPAAPPERPSTIDLSRGSPDPAASGAGDPGTLERWKEHVRLERRTEQIGPAGPRQGTVSETEAALKIPVDESVSLEGGVRVDSREEPSAKEPVRRSTPRVGVEVKF